jgi:two-component system, cell cycle response regulator CpdR
MGRAVLVVEDDPKVSELVAGMLEDLGCEVTRAQTGEDALALLANDRRIEILITDINMPGMAGNELAEKAKRFRPRLKAILLSGREIDSHGLPLIRKPFMLNDLVHVMEETTGLCR